jgi:hypothetical protein
MSLEGRSPEIFNPGSETGYPVALVMRVRDRTGFAVVDSGL